MDEHIGTDRGKEFRKNSTLSDQEAARQKLKLASDYTYLIDSVHHRNVIPFFYGISLVLLRIVTTGVKSLIFLVLFSYKNFEIRNSLTVL